MSGRGNTTLASAGRTEENLEKHQYVAQVPRGSECQLFLSSHSCCHGYGPAVAATQNSGVSITITAALPTLYSPVITICTASLTFSNSTFCPHSVFMCFVWISEQTAIISLYNINWLVCITEKDSVYCAVRINIFQMPTSKSILGWVYFWREFI